MRILAFLRVHVLFLALAAWVLPAIAGEGGFTDAAFPLWALDQNGQFIVIDTAQSTYRPAPHQFPSYLPAPYSFTYDPSRGLIWALFQVQGLSYGEIDTFLEYLDPHSGATGRTSVMNPGRVPYSLTYRPSDGQLCAFEQVLGTGQNGTPPQFVIETIDPETAMTGYVAQIQPMQVEWRGSYLFNNDPPLNLTFDDTGACYYQSSLSGDGGVLFHLDLRTGMSTVLAGDWDSIALAFEPMSHKLYGITPNMGPGGRLWMARIPKSLDGTGYVNTQVVMGVPTPNNLLTAMAFVPHSERD